MATKVNFVFSGVLGFVKHPTEQRACVLMANAMVGSYQGPGRVSNPQRSDKTASSVDGGELVRHFGFLRIPGRHVGHDDDSELVRYLHRERVSLKLPGALPGTAWDLAAMVQLADIAGTSCAVDPDALAATPSNSVLAQVVLDGGDFQVTREGGQWVVLDAPGGVARDLGTLPFEAVWSTTGDGPVEIEFTAMDGGAASTMSLTPVNDEVTVNVSNLCHENPLRWTHFTEEQRDDLDFRWHYELLAQTAKAQVSQLVVPGGLAPRPGPATMVHEFFAGSGMNCMFAAYPDAAFDL